MLGLSYAQKVEKQYIPQVFFDKNDANNRLKDGKSMIKGVAYGRDVANVMSGGSGKKQFAENVNVAIYPLTKYIEEWYRLNMKNKSASVLIVDGVLDSKRVTTTDEFGNFVFNKMKPGKYLLLALMDLEHTRTATEKVGAWVNGYGYEVASIYNSYGYSYFSEHLAHKIVEIKENGELLEVNLKPKSPFIELVGIKGADNNNCYMLNNQLTGTCNLYHSNGNLRSVADFKENLFNGDLTFFDKNGKIESKAKMKKNVLDGDLIFYNENGLPKYKQNFSKGKKTNLLIAYVYDKDNKLYYDNSFNYEGEISDITSRTKLIKDGDFHVYYPNGKVKELNVYKDDYLVSVTMYDTKGKAKQIGATVNGRFKGDYIYYNDNGKPYQVETWDNGVMVSSKKL